MADQTYRRSLHVVNAIPTTSFVAIHHDAWHPPTDVYETESEIIVKVDVAGVEEGNMEVSIEEGILRVHGYRTDCSAFSKQAVHRMEIMCGEFETHVHVPHAIDSNAEIECIYRNGMLTITLLKQVARRVQVVAEQQ
jgi:HSP20 family protein